MRAATAATTRFDFAGSTVRRAIVALVALKLAGIVLVIDPQGLQSFDFPKSLFSRALAWLIGGCIVIAFVRYGAGILPRTRLHLFVAGFAAAATLSAIVAPVPYVALFGDQDSYLGLSLIADMLVLYLGLAIAFRDRDDALALTAPLAAAGVIALLYGAIQRAGLDPIRWTEDAGARPFSTFGHPDDFGFALALLFAAAAAIAVGPNTPSVARAAAGVFALAALVMAGFVATRGTLLGVGAAAVAIVCVRGAFTTSQLGRAVLVITIALAGLAAVLVLTPLGARARGVASGAPIVDRALIYASAIDAFADRPLLGYGPDGFAIAYPAHRLAESAGILGPARPQVSAHDWVLQAAVSYGAIGLATLVVLIVAGTLALARAFQRHRVLAGSLLAAWCAYWVQGLVTVGSVSVDWVPWLALGVAAALTGSRARHVPLRHRALVLSTATAAVCVVGVAAGAIAFAANRDAWRAGVEDSVVASRAGELAVARDPGRATYWNRLGLALERNGRIEEAGRAYAEAARRAPYRATFWSNLTWIRLRQGDVAAAVTASRIAVTRDPNDPFASYALAEALRASGDCDEALSAARVAMWLYHDGPGFSRALARAALCSTDPGHARSILEQAVVWDSAEIHAALASLLYTAGDTELARLHAARALQIDPKNAVALSVLSALTPSR